MVVAGKRILRYAITNLLEVPDVLEGAAVQGPTSALDQPAGRMERVRADLRRWAVDRVDIVQLREKQLESGAIFSLACAAMAEFAELEEAAQPRKPAQHPGAAPGQTLAQIAGSPRPLLLINSRADIAAAAGADGVHLTSRVGELTPEAVRQVFARAGRPVCLVSISCHTSGEVRRARDHGADLILFGPVFEKRVAGTLGVASTLAMEGTGLLALREACAEAHPIPVLALGGITPETARSCVEAGAAGIAGIRLFQ